MSDVGPHHGDEYAMCDSHVHIFGPFNEFPLRENATYVPDEATVADYGRVADALRIRRVVIVQGGCYGTDNAVTINAVSELGANRARAISIIDDSFTQTKLQTMHDAGVRGIRLNLISDRSIDSRAFITRVHQVASLGWHIQLHATSGQIADLANLIRTLPLNVVIDHCGYLDPRFGADQPECKVILDLLQTGNVWIKLTSYRAEAFQGRSLSMEAIVALLANAATERCLWGTDWPHPLMPEKPRTADLLSEFKSWVSRAAARRILLANPQMLYGFEDL